MLFNVLGELPLTSPSTPVMDLLLFQKGTRPVFRSSSTDKSSLQELQGVSKVLPPPLHYAPTSCL